MWSDLSHRRASAPDINREQERAKEKGTISYNTSNGKRSKASGFPNMELKRLGLRKKTCHLPAKINYDESLVPLPFSQAFPVLASSVCLEPAQKREGYF